jgi:2-keto-4-pentenoate hydratase/2-oxohepta-3-ene-1,7-dioic acid hydratase in catechol pathway
MKLARFTEGGVTRLGKVVDDHIVDLSLACPALPRCMVDLLGAGDTALKMAARAAAAANVTLPLSAVRLEAPVSNPSKYLAIGLNYRAHVEEAAKLGVQAPPAQVWFNKQVSCVSGPYDPIHLPRVSDQLDYEVELCVVIGARCRHVAPAGALACVAGYMVANDVSVRDWQRQSPTWTLGKSFDTHGPTGPWIVTSDEIPDPQTLSLRLTVNGTQRQSSSTALMIHTVCDQIAHLSKVMTLMPGDLIATGTPAGVGMAMVPPSYLKVGDTVRAEIHGIGYIESQVIREP